MRDNHLLQDNSKYVLGMLGMGDKQLPYLYRPTIQHWVGDGGQSWLSHPGTSPVMYFSLGSFFKRSSNEPLTPGSAGKHWSASVSGHSGSAGHIISVVMLLLVCRLSNLYNKFHNFV